jgi:hypothetical protein
VMKTGFTRWHAPAFSDDGVVIKENNTKSLQFKFSNKSVLSIYTVLATNYLRSVHSITFPLLVALRSVILDSTYEK